MEVGSSYNTIHTTNYVMKDTNLSHPFHIPLKLKTLRTRENMRWCPPEVGWTNINIDGSCYRSPLYGVIGGVFRNAQSEFLRGFVQNIGNASAPITELSATMYAIEKSVELRYYRVWLKSDSLQLVRAFNQNVTVPWQVSNRWNNCKNLVKGFHFIRTHTPWEGNQVADALAKNGHGLPCFTSQWWNDPPYFLGVLLDKDNTMLPFPKLPYM